MSKAELAGRLGIEIGVLAGWESGRTKASPHVVEAIAWELGTTVDGILPPRRQVATPAPGSPDQVAAFVRLVTTLRRARPGAVLRFRTADLEQLALALGTEVTDVEGRIAALTSCTKGEAVELRRRLLRRKLLVPVAAGAFAAAALVMGSAVATAGTPAPAAASGTPTTGTPTTGPTGAPTSGPSGTPTTGPTGTGTAADRQVAALTAQVAALADDLARAHATIADLQRQLAGSGRG